MSVPEVFTPERASMRKTFVTSYRKLLDAPVLPTDDADKTVEHVMADLLAGLLGYTERPTAFWDMTCTEDGLVIGRRLKDGKPVPLHTRAKVRATVMLAAFRLGVPPPAAAYLLSLVPQPETRLAQWRKSWAEVPGLS